MVKDFIITALRMATHPSSWRGSLARRFPRLTRAYSRLYRLGKTYEFLQVGIVLALGFLASESIFGDRLARGAIFFEPIGAIRRIIQDFFNCHDFTCFV
jgi:hypothetical protein